MSIGDERLMILKMLEQRKINSDEATKLLDAVERNKKGESEKIKVNLNKKVDEFSTKVEKIGKNIAAGTVGVADKIMDFVENFIETNSFNLTQNYNIYEKIFQFSNVSENTDLLIEGLNGKIILKNHSLDCITVKSIIKSQKNSLEEIISIVESDNKIALQVNNTLNVSVSHEVLLPNIRINNIELIMLGVAH